MTSELTTVRFAGGAQGFNWLPVFVAEEQGIFSRYGLAIEYQRLGSVDKATTAVREGTADLAITPPEGAIADYLAGGALRLIASNSERLPMSMVARPGFPDLASLRGARIGTSSLTEGTAIYTLTMLSAVGLRYPDDFEFVLAGVHTARWAALKAHEIDAAPQPAPWSFLAEREGYRRIGEMPDVLPEIIFAAVIGNEAWVAANRDVVHRMIQAMSEAHDFVNNPANDDVTVPIYQRITTPDDPDLARQGFEYTRGLGMWPARLRVSQAAFAATIDAMIHAALMTSELRVRAFGALDSSFAEQA